MDRVTAGYKAGWNDTVYGIDTYTGCSSGLTLDEWVLMMKRLATRLLEEPGRARSNDDYCHGCRDVCLRYLEGRRSERME